MTMNQPGSLHKNTGQTGGDGMRNCWKNLFTPYRSRVVCCMVHQSQVKISVNNPGNNFSFLFYMAPISNNLLWSLFVPLSTKKGAATWSQRQKMAHMELLFLILYRDALEEYLFAGLIPNLSIKRLSCNNDVPLRIFSTTLVRFQH